MSTPPSPDRAALVRDLYDAFNARDLDAVVAAMAPDVDWPNGWEGGRLHGTDAVQDYWRRQWVELRPVTTPTSVAERADGSVEARVRLVVRDPAGMVLARSEVVHLYEFDDDLVRRMTIEEPGRPRT